MTLYIFDMPTHYRIITKITVINSDFFLSVASARETPSPPKNLIEVETLGPYSGLF